LVRVVRKPASFAFGPDEIPRPFAEPSSRFVALEANPARHFPKKSYVLLDRSSPADDDSRRREIAGLPDLRERTIMAKTRILLADDHAILRAGLRILVNAQSDMEVVAEAADGRDVLRAAQATKPDVVVLDISLPDVRGLKVIEQLRQDCPESRVLIFTGQDHPSYIRAALAAGATGYVVKSATETELLTAIRAVRSGRTFVAAQLDGNQVQAVLGNRRPRDRKARDPNANPLSARELQVLELLAQGHTNQEIGERLHLSVKTIETYRLRVSDKLGLRGRASLTRYAADIGLLGFSTTPTSKVTT
jgi:DNA-binding NarL/FixJ family response regulator